VSDISALLKEHTQEEDPQSAGKAALLAEEPQTEAEPEAAPDAPQTADVPDEEDEPSPLGGLLQEHLSAGARAVVGMQAGRQMGGDRAAEIVDLSNKSGLDREMVDRNLDEVRAKQADADFKETAKKTTEENPGTAAWVSQDMYKAALADGDFGILNQIEDAIVGTYNAIASENTANAIARKGLYEPRLGAYTSFFGAPFEQFAIDDARAAAVVKAGQKPDATLDEKGAGFLAEYFNIWSPRRVLLEGVTGLVRSADEAFTGRPEQSNLEYVRAQRKGLDAEIKGLANTAERGSPEFYIAESIGGAVGMAPTIAARLAGGPVYGTAVSLGELGQRVYGLAFNEGIDSKGLTVQQASDRALVLAMFEAITEKIPLDKIVEPIVKTGKRGITRRAKNILAAMGLEGAQEVLVETLNMGYDMGVLGEDIKSEDAVQNLVDAFIIGGGSAGIMSSGTNIAGAVMDKRRAVSARQRTANQLDLARESVLRTRSPEHFTEYYQTLAEQNDLPTIGIDVEPVVDYLTEQGEDPGEFFQMLGVEADAVKNAYEMGLDVDVQAGKFFTEMPENPYRDIILMNIRETEAAPTMAQAEIRTEQMRERLDQAYEELTSADRKEVEDASKRLRNQFVEDAVAAGRARSEAINQAAVYEAYFRTTIDAFANDPNRTRPLAEIVNELERDVFNIRTRSVPFAERGEPLETESELEQTLRRTGRLEITPAEQTFFDEIFDDQNTLDELLEVAPSLTVEDGVMSIAENDIDAFMNKMLDFQAGDGASSLPPRFRATTAYARSFAGRMAFEQTVDTTSENFRNWFRDSAVVDENGEPRVVFHGTNAVIESFDPEMLGSKNWMADSAREGFFFAGSPDTSEAYTGLDAMQATGLSMFNPEAQKVLEPFQPEQTAIAEEMNALTEKAREDLRATERYQQALAVTLDDVESIDFNTDEMQAFLRSIDQNIAQAEYGVSFAEYVDRQIAEAGLNDRQAELDRESTAALEAYGVDQLGLQPNIMPVYLSIQNPLIVDMADVEKSTEGLTQNIQLAKRDGHDGVIFKNLQDGGPAADDIFVAFEPTQIKSQFNQGTFDTDDPRILFQNKYNPPKQPAVPPQNYKLTKADRDNVKKLKASNPKLSRLASALTEEEQSALTPAITKHFVENYENFPSPAETAAVALSGRAKRGWYQNSVRAVETIFGEDAPRFVALLAGTSPQTSVESNTINTLNIWKNWIAAGRPQDPDAILKIMGESVQGDKGEDSVLGAWINNSVGALMAEDPEAFVLSGPKVNSFALNLRGFLDEVTNDTWMANFANSEQELFGKTGNRLPGKGGGYLAMNAVARGAAKKLTTDDDQWRGAEIQETVWSWAKALLEKANSAGETRSALKILTDGDLTHEMVNDVPDFEKLFLQSPYRSVLEEAGYGEQLAQVQQSVDTRLASEQPLTGSVYDGLDEKTQANLRRAARRLDALRARRAFEKQTAEILVNLSAATGTIPGLDQLQKAANDGDASANVALQEVARNSLTYLFDGIDSAEVEFTPAGGLYFGELEPSLGLKVTFQERDRPKALGALAKFAENFNQEQVHVRAAPVARNRAKIGRVFDDGSYNTHVIQFDLENPLTREEVQDVIDKSGLVGLTIKDQYLEAYHVGDPNDGEGFKKFEESIGRAAASLGDRSRSVNESVARLWVYGEGYGVTHGYDAIQRQLRPAKTEDPNVTTQMIASRLAGFNVKGTEPAKETTPEQAALQREIADAFDKLEMNRLDDPDVARAYTELAQELGRQYDAMPIKVEVWTGKGEPYPGKKMSKKMRDDVLLNNHLYIYKTELDQFGPPGQSYDGHPLLEDSGRVDMNGEPLVFNDLLRAVHDYYAHTITPGTFGPRGEEAAWRNHMEMTTSPWARWALTTETRGQNSWVNFRAEAEGKTLAERGFSEQKVDLLPLGYVMTGNGLVDSSLGQLPGSEGLNLEMPPQTPELYSDPKDPLGSFDPVRRVISLFEDANYSTLLHESGHAFVQILEEISDRPDAPQRIKDNYQAMLDWVGAKSAADMDFMTKGEPAREKQERLARAFEAYLREGKAPSSKLQSAFDQFRLWLRKIYENLLDLNVQMNPEITQVFDRMLATDQEIDEMMAVNEFTIEDSPSILSLLDAEQRVAAQDLQLQARDRVREMRNIEQERHAASLESEAYSEERTGVSLEVRAEVEAEQDFRSHIYLTTGEYNDRETPEALQGRRISRKAMLDAGYTKEQLEAIPRASDNGKSGKAVYSSNEEDATDPEFLAGFLGYDSGADLMAAMIELSAREDEINRRTDAIMGDRPQYRDPARDGTLLELSKEFAYNAEQAKLIDLELDALAQKAGMERDSRAFVQAVADRMFREEQVGDMLSPTKFAAASRRAARRAEQAAAKGNWQKALLEKRKEQLNFELHRRAIKAKKEVSGINKRLKFLKTKRYSPKEIDPRYSAEMQALLQFYEFGQKSKSDKMDRQVAQRVADFIAARQLEGANLILPGDLIEVASMDPETQQPRYVFKTKFWKEMTLAELRALRDMAENLRKIGADQSGAAKAAKKKWHEELADGIRNATRRRVKSRDPMKPQEYGKLKKLAAKGGFSASHRKLESMLLQLDGFKALGPVYKAIMNGLSDASDTKAALVTEIMRRMNLNLDIYDVRDRKNFSNDKGRVAIAALGGARWTREQRVTLALNWGNETSREAVLDDQSKINDYGQAWNETTINEILATLDNKDMDFIEATWKLIDSFWEDYTLPNGRVLQGIKSLETKMAGFAPPKIDPDPFFINGRMMEGGYYPLMYDPLSDERSAKESEADLKKRLESGGFARAATSHGFTNARVGSGGRAVRGDLSALNRHLDEVTQDLSYREAVIQAAEVLGSNDVRDAIKETMGAPYLKALEEILVLTATGGMTTNDMGPIENFMASARINVTVGIMGLNLRSIALQPLGLLQSIERLGVKQVGKGLAWFWKRPHHIQHRIKQINDLSPYMAERSNTMTRELDDLSNQIQKKTKLKNMKEFGFKPMVFLDVISVAYPTWWGAYDAAMAGKIDNIDVADEASAIRFADMQVRTTQGSGGAQNLSKVQQSSEFMKLMTMFYGYFNTTYNLQAEAWQKARADGSSVPRALLKKEFIGSTILLQTLPAILADLVLEKWPDEEEDDEDPIYAWTKWALISQAKYTSAQFVGIRDAVSSVISGFDLSITPALAPGQGFGTLINMAGRPIKALAEDGPEVAGDELQELLVSPRLYKKLITTAGMAAGVPGSNGIARSAEYLYKYATDDLKKDPRNVFEFGQGLLFTGDR